jgi:UrcA family protein
VDVTVNARIAVDMETLKNKSGVVLLKDRVEEAAYKACYAADPLTGDDGTCVANAMKSAKAQVFQGSNPCLSAISKGRARSTERGSSTFPAPVSILLRLSAMSLPSHAYSPAFTFPNRTIAPSEGMASVCTAGLALTLAPVPSARPCNSKAVST